jgi:hypothetical protein
VGVSGIFLRAERSEAIASYSQHIFNIGDADADFLIFTYEIPSMEVAMVATDTRGPLAVAQAVLVYTLFNDQREIIDAGVVFDYRLELQNTSSGSIVRRSADLEREQGSGFSFSVEGDASATTVSAVFASCRTYRRAACCLSTTN